MPVGLLSLAAPAIAAPTLGMDAAWNSSKSSPIFAVQAAWIDQDDLQFEYRLIGAGSWTVSNHTVLINEINGATIDFGVAPLTNGDYEARCKFKHFGASYSAYSNVQTFTISALPLPVVTYRGNGQAGGSGNTTDFTIDIGTASADRLIVVTAAWQNTNGITSIIVDPAGANVTLTQDVINEAGSSAAVYSGLVTSGSGSKTIRMTLVSGGFLNRGIAVWTITTLVSNTKKQSGSSALSSGNFNISAQEGDVMFAALYNDPNGSTRTYSTSSEAPTALRTSHANNQFAEWAITADNSSFNVTPGATGNTNAAVIYR